MSETYTTKYFSERLKALRVLLIRSNDKYKTVEELLQLASQNKEPITSQNEGR